MASPTINIYCIALEGNGPTGVDWYWYQNRRDAAVGYTGAEIEIEFDIKVPADATYEETTNLADQAAWNKTYLEKA